MVTALNVWDQSWASEGPDAAALARVCSPDLRVLDGYVSA